jgi:hypothetical protein
MGFCFVIPSFGIRHYTLCSSAVVSLGSFQWQEQNHISPALSPKMLAERVMRFSAWDGFLGRAVWFCPEWVCSPSSAAPEVQKPGALKLYFTN